MSAAAKKILNDPFHIGIKTTVGLKLIFNTEKQKPNILSGFLIFLIIIVDALLSHKSINIIYFD